MNTLFAIFFYLSTLVFVVGLLHRIRTYANTPAPLKIPTTPAPTTTGGVVLRTKAEQPK
jgi:nitrate reductase gamma subunit